MLTTLTLEFWYIKTFDWLLLIILLPLYQHIRATQRRKERGSKGSDEPPFQTRI